MDALVDVIDVAVIGDFRLRLRFRDGTVGDVGFEDREWRGVFEPLADPTFFARVSVDTECGTVTWPNGVEMAPEPALRGSAGQPRHGFFDELTRRLAAGAVAHRS